MAAPDLNSNYFRNQLHGILSHALTIQRTQFDAYFAGRKNDHKAQEMSQEESLQELAILIELLITWGKKNGYQEVEELLETLGLSEAQLLESKNDAVDEDDE